MGTWQTGENAKHSQSEINALRYGLNLDLSLDELAALDTAFPRPTNPVFLQML